MKRVITKRLREQAALICALRASCWAGNPRYPGGMNEQTSAVGASDDAESLARTAYAEVPPFHKPCGASYAVEWAEAESWIRTGFVPEGWRDA